MAEDDEPSGEAGLTFGRDDLRGWIRKQFLSRGVDLAHEDAPGVPAEEIVAESAVRNAEVKSWYLELWIEALDQAIGWLFSLFDAVLPKKEELGSPMTEFHRCVWMVISKLLSDSLAIRGLIVLGFDVQARVLLRSTAEYFELLVILIDHPVLASDFRKTDTIEGAKAFWRQHLRAHNVRRKVQEAWANAMPEFPDAAEWFSGWGAGWTSRLSSLSHPSFSGGVFSLIPIKSEYKEDNWLGVFGDKSDASVDTVNIYLANIFPLLLLSRKFPFEGFGLQFGRDMRLDSTNKMNTHVSVGRDVLASMILSFNKEENRFIFPEWDFSIWGSD